jgi:hypothetical protein
MKPPGAVGDQAIQQSCIRAFDEPDMMQDPCERSPAAAVSDLVVWSPPEVTSLGGAFGKTQHHNFRIVVAPRKRIAGNAPTSMFRLQLIESERLSAMASRAFNFTVLW